MFRQDFQNLLNDWPYDPSRVNVRKIKGRDGREKIQLRLDMGILQMETTGRPDGTRPFNKASLLEYFTEKARSFRAKYGFDEFFVLSHSDCLKLQREALQYYHRFVALLYLKEYDGVIRDTNHNLRIIDLVTRYAADERDIMSFTQFRPYLLMMQIRAKASLFMARYDFKKAEEIVEKGISEIEHFYIENDMSEQLESSVVLSFLKKWSQEIRESRPLSPLEKLQRELNEAVSREDFERAAELRDRIQEIQEFGDELLS
ncbi:MAG: hypothetical protein GXO76_08975 [Calditrichaeota bacterium]|nr:hypothetical protein [Calditrichota bacterium]